MPGMHARWPTNRMCRSFSMAQCGCAARPQGDRDLSASPSACARMSVLLAVKSMGSESAQAWRGILDDLIGRGLCRPELLIVDGGQGREKALAAVWDDGTTMHRS